MSNPMQFAEQGIEKLLYSVPPACIEPLNAFYRRRGPIRANALGRTIELAAAFGRESRQPFWRLEIGIDGEKGVLLLPDPLADLIFLELDGGPSIADFDPGQAALLIELALSGALEKIEAGIGAKISVISVAPKTERFEPLPEPLFTFDLPIAKPGLLHIHLHLPPGPSLRLANYMNASAPRRSQDPEGLAALPFSACIRAGAFAFSHARLAELMAGDVILLDQKSSVLPGAALIIGETLAAPLEIRGGNAILIDAPKKAMGTVLEGMTAKGIEAWSAQDGLELDKDGIPVTVTVELRRFQASLEDLHRYSRGTIVPLGSDGKDLEILANGKAIGLGRVAAIGNSTGIMVTRLIQRQPGLARGRTR